MFTPWPRYSIPLATRAAPTTPSSSWAVSVIGFLRVGLNYRLHHTHRFPAPPQVEGSSEERPRVVRTAISIGGGRCPRTAHIPLRLRRGGRAPRLVGFGDSRLPARRFAVQALRNPLRRLRMDGEQTSPVLDRNRHITFLLYAARAARGFGDGFAVIILPAYLAEIGFDAFQS